MKYDWSDLEVFRHTGAKFGVPFVNISEKKTIKLSSGFIHHAKKQIAGMTHVILNFSRANNAIVFKFTEKNGIPGETKISVRAGSIISAKPFFNYYLIDTKKYAGKHIAVLEDIPGIGESWIVYLDKNISSFF